MIRQDLPSRNAQGLLEQGPRFASWFLSFAILCRLWIIQHALLVEGDTRSRGFMGWNFLFLGAIAFLPYPTSLLSEHHDQALSVVLFSAVLGVAGVALGGMSGAHQRHRAGTGTPNAMVSSAGRAAALLMFAAVAASGAAALSPEIGALVWVGFAIAAALVRHRSAGHGQPGADKREG